MSLLSSSRNPFELTEQVINNNHRIQAVKLAFDHLEISYEVA